MYDALRRAAKLVALKARLKVQLHLQAPDRDRITIGKGAAAATLTGPPVELLLYLQGRRSASRAQLGGDAAAVAAVEAASFSI